VAERFLAWIDSLPPRRYNGEPLVVIIGNKPVIVNENLIS